MKLYRPPSGMNRYIPLATVAILCLIIGVTLGIQLPRASVLTMDSLTTTKSSIPTTLTTTSHVSSVTATTSFISTTFATTQLGKLPFQSLQIVNVSFPVPYSVGIWTNRTSTNLPIISNLSLVQNSSTDVALIDFFVKVPSFIFATTTAFYINSHSNDTAFYFNVTSTLDTRVNSIITNESVSGWIQIFSWEG